MSPRGPLVRFLTGLALVLGAVLAVVGGLALRPSGLVAVGLASVVTGCLAAGITWDTTGQGRAATMAAGLQTAAWTVTVLLVLSGATVLGGPVVAVLLAGSAAAVVGGVALVRSGRASAAALRGESLVAPVAAGRGPVVTSPPPRPPVAEQSTQALGREWVWTSTALAGRLDPGARRALVLRRQEILDELERRDPAGFAQWLACTPPPGSDPTAHLQHGDPAA